MECVESPWNDAVETLKIILAESPNITQELNDFVLNENSYKINGSGYVVDCLMSARWCVENNYSYGSVVKSAIALGNDTDTTACVAGGIAGLIYGERGIPVDWRKKLRDHDKAIRLISQI